MLTDTSYYQVSRWMSSVLGLKKTNKEVFAIIWGFCRDGHSFRGSAEYIADLADVSRAGVFAALNELERLDYIERFGKPTEIVVTEKVRQLLEANGVEIRVSNKSKIWTTKEKTVQKLDSKVQKLDSQSPKIGLSQSKNWTPNNTKDSIVDSIVYNIDDNKSETPTRPRHAVVAAAPKAPSGQDTKAIAEAYGKAYLADTIAVEAACMSREISKEQFREALREFFTFKVAEGARWHSEKDFRSNFLNWLPQWKRRKYIGIAYTRPDDAGGYKRP